MTIIECPSGLTGDIRGLKLKEANLLANRSAMKSGKAYNSILTNCWLSITDPGPYDVGDSEKVDWNKALIADRFFALTRIRAATYGDEYNFTLNCGECRQLIEWTLNLADLPVKKIPTDSLDIFKAGNDFTSTVVAEGKEHTIHFGLQTGEGELQASRLMEKNQTQLIVAALCSRIKSIDGVDNRDRVKFVEELDMGQLLELREEFDKVDGGVETGIEIDCDKCGHRMEVELPLGAEFFVPKKRRKTSGSGLRL